MKKEIGKIQEARFGFGGYQDVMIGISFIFGSDSPGWGVATFVDVREDQFGGQVEAWLTQAKVKNVSDLKGTPVEVTFDGNVLSEWRVLTEVL